MTTSRRQCNELCHLLWSMKEGAISAGGIDRIDSLVRCDTALLQLYVEYTRLVADLRFGPTNRRVERMLARLFGTDDIKNEDGQGSANDGDDQRGVMNDPCAGQHSPFAIRDLSPSSAVPASSGLGFLSATFQNVIGRFPENMPLAYLLATVVTGLGLLIASHVYMSRPEPVVCSSVPSVVAEPKRIGKITGMADCRWADPKTQDPRPKTPFALGDRFALSSGLLEITYNSGARVILQGPVTYEVDSTNGGFLSLGKLTGKLEKKGEGGRRKAEEPGDPKSTFPLPPSPFVVRTPTATVTDLGTEFGIEVTNDQQSRVHVFQGTVVVRTQVTKATVPHEIELNAGELVSVGPQGAMTHHSGRQVQTALNAIGFVSQDSQRSCQGVKSGRHGGGW